MSLTGAKNIGFEDGRFFLSDEDPIDDAGCSEEDTLCQNERLRKSERDCSIVHYLTCYMHVTSP